MPPTPSDKQQLLYTADRRPAEAVVAPKKRVSPKVGERWVPKSGNPGGFTVVESTPDGIVVEVERRVPKDGDIKTELRTRSIDGNTLPFFLMGYRKAPK